MKCIIVDDEPLARETVQLLVEETPGLNLSESFADATSAGRFLSENKVDVVFLDIRMPGINGIEFAQTIPNNTLVIFTTAYSEYAVNTLHIDSFDNNDIFIKTFEIPIGSTYRDIFLEEFVTKNVIKGS